MKKSMTTLYCKGQIDNVLQQNHALIREVILPVKPGRFIIPAASEIFFIKVRLLFSIGLIYFNSLNTGRIISSSQQPL
jgi:hypothetical protein